MTKKKNRIIKIGIDVGGTFTHAVAVDAERMELIGKAMVPTTHRAREGVALGVVESMKQLLNDTGIQPEEVSLIAHSTTQATNALLEGDVAPVGIIAMGKGLEGKRARSESRLKKFELAPGKLLKIHHRYFDVADGLDRDSVKAAIGEIVAEGARVIVAVEAFGVDHPENERTVVSIAEEMGLLGTAASDISKLYGLRVRTRTAALNACIMPKMLETANMTEESVRASGIEAPLMVMRSDGGIMDVHEMRRRPILTMLSGPAAGVAAALMYVKISDGIFVEVGGTSTDISVIKNGRPMIRSAEIGGHRLYVKTLDVRTVGIAGGSMPRYSGKKLIDVGPRSAHIAGLRYTSFVEPDVIQNPKMESITPIPGDPDDYMAIMVEKSEEPGLALTPTEAANLLGYIKGYAEGNKESIQKVFDYVSGEFGKIPEDFAREILNVATDKVIDVVKDLIVDYKLEQSLVTLVGGGGGAGALVPFTAERMKLRNDIAENAEVISAIGVALGMIRDTVERNIIHPTEDDILRIRKEAAEAVMRMGAAEETIEVRVEVDPKAKKVSATATGSSEMRQRDLQKMRLADDELLEQARQAFGNGECTVEKLDETEFLKIFRGQWEIPRFFGLFKKRREPVYVFDIEGVVRLKMPAALFRPTTVTELGGSLDNLISHNTTYGDAGGLPPDIFLIVSGKIIDLTGLVNKEQIVSIARVELEKFSRDERVLILAAKKSV